MNDNEHSSYPADETPESTSRRKFLGAAALTGLTGAGLATGLAALGSGEAKAEKEEEGEREADKFEVPPGQLDDYYIFSSGGHSGEVRIYGLPSGRTIKRIPVFNIDPMVGWGITNESKKVIGTKPDGSLKYITGDTHHVHGSYTDGTYDSRYLWVNDKIHGRLARIRMDYMECDKITELPNMQGFHGLFPDKRDPVDPKINRTTRVFCGGEFHVPLPNDGRDMDDSKKWACLFSCVDADSMEVRWQCKVTGNMDLVATSYDGKLAAANQYNTEGGAIYTDMMSACLLYTSPSPRDRTRSRMPSSA